MRRILEGSREHVPLNFERVNALTALAPSAAVSVGGATVARPRAAAALRAPVKRDSQLDD